MLEQTFTVEASSSYTSPIASSGSQVTQAS